MYPLPPSVLISNFFILPQHVVYLFPLSPSPGNGLSLSPSPVFSSSIIFTLSCTRLQSISFPLSPSPSVPLFSKSSLYLFPLPTSLNLPRLHHHASTTPIPSTNCSASHPCYSTGFPPPLLVLSLRSSIVLHSNRGEENNSEKEPPISARPLERAGWRRSDMTILHDFLIFALVEE